MIRPALSALLFFAAPPALALDCIPQTSCSIEGNCAPVSGEGGFRLTRDLAGYSMTSLPDNAPGEPPLQLAESPRADETMRSFITPASPSGDAVLFSLIKGRHFILSIHGQIDGTPYAFLSEGTCEGSL
ncbi:hypothetical protein KUV47_05830 [Vannielia litorea]|uniref:hypothetical protein n=1 Tax=Vannielia litorea TaxID=1217970 RepID=UPI001C961465|nr:hypothetical protein [Vannielia litorea]MBY6152723.1 hypothetical protein [Vannielia litorea]